MRKAASFFINLFASVMIFSGLYGDAGDSESDRLSTPKATAPFTAFTGKITKNKVRMRLQPNLDGPILRELSRDEMLIVVGETEDFYAVQPNDNIKAYIFRTYVLDGVVEGNKVNVRLEPDLDAPVIAQLSSGDRVQGIVSPLNSKWLEIQPPASVRFYISKEYVEKAGDASFLANQQKRRDEVNRLLNSTYLISQTEMQKPFDQINLDGILNNLNKVVAQYSDFPDQVTRARTMLTMIQDNYLQKKIAYLEAKAKSSEVWQAKSSDLSTQIQAQQDRLSQLEEKLQADGKKTQSASETMTAVSSPTPKDDSQPNSRMSQWVPIEQQLYEAWANENGGKPLDAFYRDQKQNAIALTGIVEPYTRPVKNKPGNFVLVSQATHLPIAYLYSTQVDLMERSGQEITILATPRPNNHFAFPAYFVLSYQ